MLAVCKFPVIPVYQRLHLMLTASTFAVEMLRAAERIRSEATAQVTLLAAAADMLVDLPTTSAGSAALPEGWEHIVEFLRVEEAKDKLSEMEERLSEVVNYPQLF